MSCQFFGPYSYVAGFWSVIYIESSRFALDTLMVANRSPTPASKIYDFLGLLDDICGGPGPPFPADLGESGGPMSVLSR